MKFLVVLAVAVACAAADVSHIVPSDESLAPILKSEYQISPETNSYLYSYETGNGISAQAEGILKESKIQGEAPYYEVRGGYQYTAPDGTPVDVQYISNENGIQVTGSHIPVPPPIPEPIARALAYIAAHPPPVVPEPERVVTKP